MAGPNNSALHAAISGILMGSGESFLNDEGVDDSVVFEATDAILKTIHEQPTPPRAEQVIRDFMNDEQGASVASQYTASLLKLLGDAGLVIIDLSTPVKQLPGPEHVTAADHQLLRNLGAYGDEFGDWKGDEDVRNHNA